MHLSESIPSRERSELPDYWDAANEPPPDRALPDRLDWMSYFHRCSRLLVAVVEPTTMTLHYANDCFCTLIGTTGDRPVNLGAAWEQLLAAQDAAAIERLYRRHLLHWVLQKFYHLEPRGGRLLDEPVMVTLPSPHYPEPRYIEFWLRSEQLHIARRDPTIDEFAALGLADLTQHALEEWLTNPAQMHQLLQQIQVENYDIAGWLLLEGLDVTDRETIRRITQLLIDRDSILKPQKFAEVDQQMRSLFRADNTVVLSVETDQTRLFMGSVSQHLDTMTFSLDSLQESQFIKAVQTNQITVVPDLAQSVQTVCGQQLLALGVRSLLLIPLVSTTAQGEIHLPVPPIAQIPIAPTHAIGVVGVLSNCPNHFDGLDCRHADQLIPAFAAALISAQRQLVQQRFFNNIHPAVEWRFLQEADRRSLGLPAEPIVFTEVYPLYGISDIRGSSEERNRAIQADLLEQFHLGLAVVDAAIVAHETAMTEQLRLDLLEQVQLIEAKVTVDAEVSGIRYLRDHLELYFDYFSQCGDAAIAAVNAYRMACQNEHLCVYNARAAYDRTIGNVNARLRETWDRWQARMQRISQHYCDTESTDGIDHMLYVGPSIDPKFGNFHLRSLRYEQLRAVCDCARTMLSLQEHCNSSLQVTHLVLVQDATVDIFHDETTESLFDVRGSRDTRYEIVKKRIDKALDEQAQTRITQPGMLTIVYSSEEEWAEYQQYIRYLMREGWVDDHLDRGLVQPLQGVNGLKYARLRVLPG